MRVKHPHLTKRKKKGGLVNKKIIRIQALIACLAITVTAYLCNARSRVLTYEQAEKMGPLENIVGYKNAARYRTCKRLYGNVGKVLEDPNFVKFGPKECPRGQRLADMCYSLPTDTPEKQQVKDAVVAFIAPRPCVPGGKKAPEKTECEMLRELFEKEAQFAEKVLEVMSAYKQYEDLKNPFSYAELKTEWEEYLNLAYSVNTLFADLSAKILKQTIAEDLVTIDPIIQAVIESALKKGTDQK